MPRSAPLGQQGTEQPTRRNHERRGANIGQSCPDEAA